MAASWLVSEKREPQIKCCKTLKTFFPCLLENIPGPEYPRTHVLKPLYTQLGLSKLGGFMCSVWTYNEFILFDMESSMIFLVLFYVVILVWGCFCMGLFYVVGLFLMWLFLSGVVLVCGCFCLGLFCMGLFLYVVVIVRGCFLMGLFGRGLFWVVTTVNMCNVLQTAKLHLNFFLGKKTVWLIADL